MKKKHTLRNVVITIIVLELIVGGIVFGYKKLHNNEDNNSLSLSDPLVLELYQKVDFNDLDILDIMSDDAKLYYGYHNLGTKETVDCSEVEIEDDTTGYTCIEEDNFIPSSTLLEAVYDVYGSDTSVTVKSFPITENIYGYYSSLLDGIVLYEKEEQVVVDPINMKLTDATKEDENIIITVQVLDGIFGTELESYNYTFRQVDDEYHLVQKETINLDN